MLFDEAELLTLDQVAVKNTTDKEKLKQKPAPLIDCVYRNMMNKETFQIPSADDISKLKVGDLVKLIFFNPNATGQTPKAERMWVILTEINGTKFKGTLDNDPFYLRSIKYQDIIEFEDRHICNLKAR